MNKLGTLSCGKLSNPFPENIHAVSIIRSTQHLLHECIDIWKLKPIVLKWEMVLKTDDVGNSLLMQEGWSQKHSVVLTRDVDVVVNAVAATIVKTWMTTLPTIHIGHIRFFVCAQYKMSVAWV